MALGVPGIHTTGPHPVEGHPPDDVRPVVVCPSQRYHGEPLNMTLVAVTP